MADAGTVVLDDKFSFEDLKVYHKSLEYVNFVYGITRAFPQAEVYSLANQFRRAAVSICLNIAEGSGGSIAEFKQFMKISRRSVRECVAVTEIAYRQKFISNQSKECFRNCCVELSKMLSGLIASLKK